jgi:hypothetical protein
VNSSSLDRRKWLQLSGGALAFSLAGGARADEATGKWSEKSIADYSQRLIDWLKEDFEERANLLRNAGQPDFKLNYGYLAPTEERSRLRTFEKFREGDLSETAAEKHIEACLTDFQKVLSELAAAEAIAAPGWKEPTDVTQKEGRIYDSILAAARLAVVLDNSRSMTPYLPKLREEISRDFPDAYFVEVNGCALHRPATCPWFFSGPTVWANPFSPERHIPKIPTMKDRPHSAFINWTRSATSALESMVDLMRADAIYWFCDFDDPTDDAIIREFARKVIDKKVKLFIHTVDKRAPELLATLAEKSGGKVVKKRI